MIAAAEEYDVPLRNPSFVEYAHLFESTNNSLWCKYPVQDTTDSSKTPSTKERDRIYRSTYLRAKLLHSLGLRKYPMHVIRVRQNEQCDLQSKRFQDAVQSGRTVLALGWQFRSEPLLDRHQQKIREHFRLVPKHHNTVESLSNRLRESCNVLVGVHIRHGDYKTFEGGRYFFEVSAYVKIMREIAQQLSPQEVTFLVCSNGKFEPREFAGLDVHFGPGHLVEDMYSFAKTDLIIGPPSTYTHWASFYGQVPLAFLQSASDHVDIKSVAPTLLSHVA